jgi:hypothetical protein
MKTNLALSGIALTVLALAITPVSAQSIDVLGGSGNGGATVSLGGGSSGSGTSVDVDAGSGSLLGGGSDGSLLDLGGDGDGSILNLGDNDVLDINGNGLIDGDDIVDLNGNGIVDGDEVTVDLFGPSDGGETQLAVGTDDDQDDVLVTLFGSPNAGDADGSDLARANILPNGVDGGEGDDATVTLFGNGDDDGATATADLLGGDSGVGGVGGVGDTDVTLDLFGPGTGGDGSGGTGGTGGGGGNDPTETGSIPDDGTGGGGTGAGGGGAGTGKAALPPTRVASTAAANVGTGGNCFSPDNGQIAHLIARGNYDASVTAKWQGAANISLVPVTLCPDARSRLEAAINADANLGQMQAAVAMNSAISSEIAPQYQADDVLAVDQSGQELTVYVY